MPISDGPWFASEPHPQTNACVITNPQGRVIAAMVPNRADAEFIAKARDNTLWNQLVVLWNKPAVLALLDDQELVTFQKLMIGE